MTLLLILGAACGIYLVSLLFRLAGVALPLAVAAGIGINLHSDGWGASTAMLCGLSIGIAVHVLARNLLETSRSRLVRAAIIALFMLPAGAAGYHAAHAIAGLIVGQHSILIAAGITGALVAANIAMRSITARGSRD